MNWLTHRSKNQRSKMTYKRFCRGVGYQHTPKNAHSAAKKTAEAPASSTHAAPKWVPGATLQAASYRSRASVCSGATPFGDCVLTLKTRVWLGVILP